MGRACVVQQQHGSSLDVVGWNEARRVEGTTEVAKGAKVAEEKRQTVSKFEERGHSADP